MIKRILVTNFLGESLTLTLKDPESSGFYVFGVDGLTPPTADINFTNVLSLDGKVYNSARVDGRTIVLALALIEQPSIEDARQTLYQYFPIKQPVKFTIETDNRTACIMGYVESNDSNLFTKRQMAIITIVCPDAYFRSTEPTRVLFSGIEGGFEFPFANESLDTPMLKFGEIELATERSVFYEGDASVGFVINIHALGPVGDITIHDVVSRDYITIDSDKVLAITGNSIIIGDDIIISTLKGAKTITLIRAGISHNILNALGRDASWFELVKGDNIFVYTATVGEEHLQFEILYYPLYEGV